MIFQNFLDQVQDGKEGKNRGLMTSLSAINKILYGVQKGTYYLIGGETGTGKTALVDELFVLDTFDYAKKHGKKIKIFYYSLEISKIRKIAKWTALKIFRDHGIITSMTEILGLEETPIRPEVERLVKTYESYFEELLESVILIDEGTNPTGVYVMLDNYCRNAGTFKDKIRIIKGKEVKQKIYIPTDSTETVMFIVDHIGLMKREHEKDSKVLLNKKQNIDKLSEYSIILRNTYGVAPVLISQLNRDLSDIDRQRFKELKPQLSDLKDTGNPSEDCNVAILLFNPERYNMQKYGNNRYDITKCGGRFRSVHIVKNREGNDSILIGLNFLGESGLFRQFPIQLDHNNNVLPLTDQIYEQARLFKEWKV